MKKMMRQLHSSFWIMFMTLRGRRLQRTTQGSSGQQVVDKTSTVRLRVRQVHLPLPLLVASSSALANGSSTGEGDGVHRSQHCILSKQGTKSSYMSNSSTWSLNFNLITQSHHSIPGSKMLLLQPMYGGTKKAINECEWLREIFWKHRLR